MDFDQAEAQRPVQQLELTPDDLLDDAVVGLNYVKYQNVQNLTVSTGRSIREFTSNDVASERSIRVLSILMTFTFIYLESTILITT